MISIATGRNLSWLTACSGSSALAAVVGSNFSRGTTDLSSYLDKFECLKESE